MISLRIDLSMRRARQMLAGMIRRTRDLGPVRRDFAQHMVESVTLNFLRGGRPRRWIPSRRAELTGGTTLVRTARLMKSISWRVRGNVVLVGTNVAYAAAHQFGVDKQVVQRVRAHLRRTRSGKQVVVRPHTRRVHMRLPARPFLVVQDEDLAYLEERLRAHVLGER